MSTSVADLNTTANWYVQTLGFVEEYRYKLPEMGLRAAFVSLEDFRLEIFEQTDSVAPPSDELHFDRYLGVRGLKHIALAVDEIDAARSELEPRGVACLAEPMNVPASGGERFCFFADPDGVLIELYQPVAAHEHSRGDRRSAS